MISGSAEDAFEAAQKRIMLALLEDEALPMAGTRRTYPTTCDLLGQLAAGGMSIGDILMAYDRAGISVAFDLLEINEL